MGVSTTPLWELRDIIIEEGATDIYKCYQCGKCASVCPWYQTEAVNFPTYKFPLAAQLGRIASSENKEELSREVEEVYRCVGCEACVEQCPQGLNIPNIFRAVRRILVDYGSYPETLKSVVSKIHNAGNPLGEPQEKRADWARDLDILPLQGDVEYLYFPGCFPAYDSRAQKVAQAAIKILQEGKVSFGILGEKEWCCGEAIRRAGAEKIFQELVKCNITAFKDAGVKKIVVTSPHCYTTFKNEYPSLSQDGGGFEVLHITQLFDQLLKEGRLKLKKLTELSELEGLTDSIKVVYHDPCTLGRQNGIYEEPRGVLQAIPGLELVEIENFSREYSLCCGGGSGGLWLDWPKGERMADIRVQQAANTGAEILAVACPYCLQMFEDSVKTMNLDLQVMDIAELLAEVL